LELEEIGREVDGLIVIGVKMCWVLGGEKTIILVKPGGLLTKSKSWSNMENPITFGAGFGRWSGRRKSQVWNGRDEVYWG